MSGQNAKLYLSVMSRDGKRIISKYEVTDEEITIGRDSSVTIRIQERGVSRCHAIIRHRTCLRDVSTFQGMGVHVNGVKIEYHRLSRADRIEIGAIKESRTLLIFGTLPNDITTSPENDTTIGAISESVIIGESTKPEKNYNPLSILQNIQPSRPTLEEEVQSLRRQLATVSREKDTVLKEKTLLRTRLSNVIDYVEDHYSCHVCMSVSDDMVFLNCHHNFCDTCFSRWKMIENNCPLCRSNTQFVIKPQSVNEMIRKIIREAKY